MSSERYAKNSIPISPPLLHHSRVSRKLNPDMYTVKGKVKANLNELKNIGHPLFK